MHVQLGPFEVLDQIGGGDPETWTARRTGSDAIVLVRIFRRRPTSQAHVEDFVERVGRWVRLSHPNIVRALDVGVVEEGCYLATEYTAGLMLRAFLVDFRAPAEPMGLAMALHIAAEACRGIFPTVAGWLVHGGISPRSIIVAADGNVKLTDYGVVQAAERLSGNPAGGAERRFYESPEQLLGRDPDPRSDVYAIGTILYECLTGHTPFSPKSRMADRLRPLLSIPVLGSRYTPQAVDEVVLRMLAPQPEDRFPHAGTARDAIEAVVASSSLLAFDTASLSEWVSLRLAGVPSKPKPKTLQGHEAAPAREARPAPGVGLTPEPALGVARAATFEDEGQTLHGPGPGLMPEMLDEQPTIARQRLPSAETAVEIGRRMSVDQPNVEDIEDVEDLEVLVEPATGMGEPVVVAPSLVGVVAPATDVEPVTGPPTAPVHAPTLPPASPSASPRRRKHRGVTFTLIILAMLQLAIFVAAYFLFR